MKYSEEIENYKKEYRKLSELSYQLGQKEMGNAQRKEFDLINQQIDLLVEGKYAQAVYDYFSESKPTLIRDLTGEKIQWFDAFGDSFDKMTRGQKHSLVGLVEDGGKYRLEDSCNEE